MSPVQILSERVVILLGYKFEPGRLANTAGQLRKILQHFIVREITGAVIMLFGAYNLVTAFNGHRHNHTTGNHGIKEHDVASKCPEHYLNDRNLDQVRYLV